MKCQYVKWIDSETDHGWTDVSQVCAPPDYAHTVGFLVTEDDDYVVLALSYDPANDQINCHIRIPKVAIRDRRTICQLKT